MYLYLMEPEVAGGFGENTTFLEDTYENGMRKISHLEYEFDGWLGDELLETTPCFIVTEKLANTIQNSCLTGYLLTEVDVTVSELFKELYPNKLLPNFKRLIPEGKVIVKNGTYNNWSGYDFCLSQNLELVVSSKALNVLKDYKLNQCDVVELNLISNCLLS